VRERSRFLLDLCLEREGNGFRFVPCSAIVDGPTYQKKCVSCSGACALPETAQECASCMQNRADAGCL
jgi:hypothetical protein